MRAILLVEERFGPVPPDIRVVQEFGREGVVTGEDEKGRPQLVWGVSMFLEGEDAAFVSWLKSFDGIWTTNNPMMGKWHVVHITA